MCKEKALTDVLLRAAISFGCDRAQLMIDDASNAARLKLSDVKTSDDGEYKCEITFLDISKNCPVVQLVKLTTLGKYTYCYKQEDTTITYMGLPFIPPNTSQRDKLSIQYCIL